MNLERWEPFSDQEKMAISVALTMEVVRVHQERLDDESMADVLEIAANIVTEVSQTMGMPGIDQELLEKALTKMRGTG